MLLRCAKREILSLISQDLLRARVCLRLRTGRRIVWSVLHPIRPAALLPPVNVAFALVCAVIVDCAYSLFSAPFTKDPVVCRVVRCRSCALYVAKQKQTSMFAHYFRLSSLSTTKIRVNRVTNRISRTVKIMLSSTSVTTSTTHTSSSISRVRKRISNRRRQLNAKTSDNHNLQSLFSPNAFVSTSYPPI